MIFKSLISYIFGIIAGLSIFYCFVYEKYIECIITVIITLLVSQLISVYIRNRMREKYWKKIRG